MKILAVRITLLLSVVIRFSTAAPLLRGERSLMTVPWMQAAFLRQS
jgi:hypothetical protein